MVFLLKKKKTTWLLVLWRYWQLLFIFITKDLAPDTQVMQSKYLTSRWKVFLRLYSKELYQSNIRVWFPKIFIISPTETFSIHHIAEELERNTTHTVPHQLLQPLDLRSVICTQLSGVQAILTLFLLQTWDLEEACKILPDFCLQHPPKTDCFMFLVYLPYTLCHSTKIFLFHLFIQHHRAPQCHLCFHRLFFHEDFPVSCHLYLQLCRELNATHV